MTARVSRCRSEHRDLVPRCGGAYGLTPCSAATDTVKGSGPAPLVAGAHVNIRPRDEGQPPRQERDAPYGISATDVEATIAEPAEREADQRGNARLAGTTGDGRPILVVVAGDDPDFVIPVFLGS